MAVASPHRLSLADVLLKEGLIDKDQYQRALDEYDRTKRSLVRILTDMGVLNEDLRLDLLRKNCDCELVRLQNVVPSADVSGYLTKDMCRRAHAVPLRKDENGVIMAMEDPTDVRTLGDMEKIFGIAVRPVLAPAKEIEETIERLPESTDDADVEAFTKPSIGYRLFSSLMLMLFVFVPLVAFYYFVQMTESGAQWFGNFALTRFEIVLLYVVTWSSWAAIAYFLHDIIFHRQKR